MEENNNNINKENIEERLNGETRPPEGHRIILHSLRFAEIINSSDFEQLEKGLENLYKNTLHFRNVMISPSEQKYYKEFIAGATTTFFPSRVMKKG